MPKLAVLNRLCCTALCPVFRRTALEGPLILAVVEQITEFLHKGPPITITEELIWQSLSFQLLIHFKSLSFRGKSRRANLGVNRRRYMP